MKRHFLTALALLQFASLAGAAKDEARQFSPTRRAQVELSACNLPGVTQSAKCATFDVPENPDLPRGRHLSISVAVIPAAEGRALPDPIVVLMGGPGEDAISAAALFNEQFASLRKDRDLLLVDQRGTGRSSALRCRLYSAAEPEASLRDLFPPDAVQRCAERLRARADLTQYTFVHFANDLEHVRRALGYASLNLFAGSYGTRAAQVFARKYPGSVRTLYLGSVVPIDVATPLTFARTTQEAFHDLFKACSSAAACHNAFPRLREEFDEIVARLDRGDVRVPVRGRGDSLPLHRGRVIEWFRSRLYRPATAAAVPWIIHQAYLGNWNPIVEALLTSAEGLDDALSLGLFFSITCSEDVAFIREEELEPATRATYLGDYRLRQQQAACAHWPKAQLAHDYRKAVRSPVPTLFVSGDTDAASPLWFTRHTAPGFENRREVVLIGRGHTEWSECVGRLYEHLVRSGTVTGLDGASCEPVGRPPFKLH